MEKQADILYRLARFLAGVPPEALGAMIVIALEYSNVLFSIALWMLNAILGDIFAAVALAFLVVYVWSRLAPQQRHAVTTALSWVLPSRVLQHLGVAPSEDKSTDEDVDNLTQDHLPKAWTNTYVEIELYVCSSDPEDFEKRYGTLVTLNDLGAVIDKTFYPWTSIKSMAPQPHAFNDVPAEETYPATNEKTEQHLKGSSW